MPSIAESKVVYPTPWCNLVAKTVSGGHDSGAAYYSLDLPDYVTVLAVRNDGKAPLVRQYRPAVEAMTLELPSGMVDEGESPEGAARRELLEESGHQAEQLELIAKLRPDSGRLCNWLWCYLALNAREVHGQHQVEPGMETVLYDATSLGELIVGGTINHALNIVAITLAQLRFSHLKLF